MLVLVVLTIFFVSSSFKIFSSMGDTKLTPPITITTVHSSSEHFAHLAVSKSPVFDGILRFSDVYCTPTVHRAY